MFVFQAEDGIRDLTVTGVQTCALPILAECSKVPVIKHYKGVCHVYVDAEADLKMAEEIAMNAKVQRPAVCNAMETLLVDRKIADAFLPLIGRRLGEKHVELRVDSAAEAILNSQIQNGKPQIRPVTEQ